MRAEPGIPIGLQGAEATPGMPLLIGLGNEDVDGGTFEGHLNLAEGQSSDRDQGNAGSPQLPSPTAKDMGDYAPAAASEVPEPPGQTCGTPAVATTPTWLRLAPLSTSLESSDTASSPLFGIPGPQAPVKTETSRKPDGAVLVSLPTAPDSQRCRPPVRWEAVPTESTHTVRKTPATEVSSDAIGSPTSDEPPEGEALELTRYPTSVTRPTPLQPATRVQVPQDPAARTTARTTIGTPPAPNPLPPDEVPAARKVVAPPAAVRSPMEARRTPRAKEAVEPEDTVLTAVSTPTGLLLLANPLPLLATEPSAVRQKASSEPAADIGGSHAQSYPSTAEEPTASAKPASGGTGTPGSSEVSGSPFRITGRSAAIPSPQAPASPGNTHPGERVAPLERRVAKPSGIPSAPLQRTASVVPPIRAIDPSKPMMVPQTRPALKVSASPVPTTPSTPLGVDHSDPVPAPQERLGMILSQSRDPVPESTGIPSPKPVDRPPSDSFLPPPSTEVDVTLHVANRSTSVTGFQILPTPGPFQGSPAKSTNGEAAPTSKPAPASPANVQSPVAYSGEPTSEATLDDPVFSSFSPGFQTSETTPNSPGLAPAIGRPEAADAEPAAEITPSTRALFPGVARRSQSLPDAGADWPIHTDFSRSQASSTDITKAPHNALVIPAREPGASASSEPQPIEVPSITHPAQSPPQEDGIPVAEQVIRMPNTLQVEESAELPGKTLPGVSRQLDFAGTGPSRRMERSSVPVHATGDAVPTLSSSQTQVSTDINPSPLPQPTAGSAPRSYADPISHQVLECVTRMRQSGSESVSVVVKPDPSTELVLHVDMNGGSPTAQIHLERGDVHRIDAHWEELQRRLADQGIKLMRPNDVGGGFDPSRDSNRRPYTAEPEVLADTPLRSLRKTLSTLSLTKTRGFESWA